MSKIINWFSANKNGIAVNLVSSAIWVILLGIVSFFLAFSWDFLGLTIRMDFVISALAYAFMVLGAITFLNKPVRWAWGKVTYHMRVSHKLTPRDYGIDNRYCRQIGFGIVAPRRKFDIRLEMFWYSGNIDPDEMQLRYPLNLTSHHLRNTLDGQFVLAIAHRGTPFGYSLVLDDGYYGLFLNCGYYKARVCMSREKESPKTCFDILIEYRGRDKVRVVEIQEIDCDDTLDHIKDKADWQSETIRNWSTVTDFQPNQMYRGGQ